METKHTPTPWIAEGQQIVAEENGYRVAIVSSPHPRARGKERMEDLEYCRGNTAFIVRACNAHDALVEYFHASQSLQMTMGHPEATAEDENKAEARYEAAAKAARDALACAVPA